MQPQGRIHLLDPIDRGVDRLLHRLPSLFSIIDEFAGLPRAPRVCLPLALEPSLFVLQFRRSRPIASGIGIFDFLRKCSETCVSFKFGPSIVHGLAGLIADDLRLLLHSSSAGVGRQVKDDRSAVHELERTNLVALLIHKRLEVTDSSAGLHRSPATIEQDFSYLIADSKDRHAGPQ